MSSERKRRFETPLLERSGPGNQKKDEEREHTELIQSFKVRGALFSFVLFFFFASLHLPSIRVPLGIKVRVC